MKSLLTIFGVLALAAGCPAGEGPTHEDIVKKTLGALDTITTSLTTITDKETAETAKPELRKVAKEWVALRAQAEKLPPPPREEKERLEKEYKGKLETAQKKLAAQVFRVQDVDGGAAALKEIRGILVKTMK